MAIAVKQAPAGFIGQMYLDESLEEFLDVTGLWCSDRDAAVRACVVAGHKRVKSIDKNIEKLKLKLEEYERHKQAIISEIANPLVKDC